MSLLNGGFENWTAGSPDDWVPNLGAGSTATQETSIVRSGSSSLKMTRIAANAEMAQTAAVTPGFTYTLSYWFNCGPAEFPFMRININGGPSNGFWAQLSTPGTIATPWASGFAQWSNTGGTSAWQNLTWGLAEIPAGATSATVDIGMSVLAYFDDISFDPDPQPPRKAGGWSTSSGGR